MLFIDAIFLKIALIWCILIYVDVNLLTPEEEFI